MKKIQVGGKYHYDGKKLKRRYLAATLGMAMCALLAGCSVNTSSDEAPSTKPNMTENESTIDLPSKSETSDTKAETVTETETETNTAKDTETESGDVSETPSEEIISSEIESGDETEIATNDETCSATEIESDENEWALSYKNLLEKNKDLILAYDWKYEYDDTEPKQVAFADIIGDENPELFFAEATENSFDDEYWWATLYMYSYDDGNLNELISFEVNHRAAGGDDYRIFKSNEKGAIWLYSEWGDDPYEFSFTKYAYNSDSHSMEEVDTYYHKIELDYTNYATDFTVSWIETYKHNGADIDKSEYDEAIKGIDGSTTDIILTNYISESTISDGFTTGHKDISVTYKDALSALDAY